MPGTRYERDGKQFKKSFGRDQGAAVAYLEKVHKIIALGDVSALPTSAKVPLLTTEERQAASKADQDAKATTSTGGDGSRDPFDLDQ